MMVTLHLYIGKGEREYDDNDRRHECSRGIHFFVERQEAINYYEREWA